MSVISGQLANISGDGAGHLGHRAKIALADHLHRKSIFDAMRIANHADDRPSRIA